MMSTEVFLFGWVQVTGESECNAHEILSIVVGVEFGACIIFVFI